MKKYILITTLILAAAACHLTKKPTMDCSTIPSTYKNDIAPIMTAHCMPCHGYGSQKGDWTSYAGLKKAVDEGTFEKRVLVKQDMPPKAPLADSLRKKIRCWLNSGAPNN